MIVQYFSLSVKVSNIGLSVKAVEKKTRICN